MAVKDPINRFIADLQPSRSFQHVSVFLQGGVLVRFKLFEKLLLMDSRHRAVTACWLGNNVQGILAMPFQIAFDRVDMHRKVPCCFIRRSATQYQRDDPSPKLQTVSTYPSGIHEAIMSNALNGLSTWHFEIFEFSTQHLIRTPIRSCSASVCWTRSNPTNGSRSKTGSGRGVQESALSRFLHETNGTRIRC